MGNVEWLSPQQLADTFGISIKTVYNWRYRGEGPRSYKIGGNTVRYRASDVEAWLEEQAKAAVA